MLLQYLPTLHAKRILLASASPRRKELLEMVGVRFDIQASTFAEDFDHSNYPEAGDYARATALMKTVDVAKAAMAGQSPPDLVIGADTIVELDGKILEKPRDHAHAHDMLRSLSGRTHRVHTGCALAVPRPGRTLADGGRREGASTRTERTELPPPAVVISFFESTVVEFAALDDAAIAAYIATHEPMDKAGAYGIQGPAGSFVTSITGCYFNVMGLPLSRLSREIVALMNQGIL